VGLQVIVVVVVVVVAVVINDVGGTVSVSVSVAVAVLGRTRAGDVLVLEEVGKAFDGEECETFEGGERLRFGEEWTCILGQRGWNKCGWTSRRRGRLKS